MPRLRRLSIGLIALFGGGTLACGCLSGLDEDALTRGRPDAAGEQLDFSGSHATCDNFLTDQVGQPPAGWFALTGTWQVVTFAGGRALEEVDMGGTGATFIDTWNAVDSTDLDVQATVFTTDATGLDCVVTRFKGPGNYDALCLDSLRNWQLFSVVDGLAKVLASGSQDFGSGGHILELQMRGAGLTAVIDGTVLATATSKLSGHGITGVGARSPDPFTRVCVTPL